MASMFCRTGCVESRVLSRVYGSRKRRRVWHTNVEVEHWQRERPGFNGCTRAFCYEATKHRKDERRLLLWHVSQIRRHLSTRVDASFNESTVKSCAAASSEDWPHEEREDVERREMSTSDRADRAGILSERDSAEDIIRTAQAQTTAPSSSRWTRQAISTCLQVGLAEEAPDQLIKAFLLANDDTNLMANLPSATFSEVLYILRPKNIVRDLIDVYVALDGQRQASIRAVPLRTVIQDYLECVLEVVNKRQEAGKKLTLADFSILLNTAKGVGATSVANAFWRMLRAEGLRPNTNCYNGYLGALVCNDLYPEYRGKERVTEFNMMRRSKQKLDFAYSNYRVFEGGIKEKTREIFNEMLKEDVPPNEETFCAVITGLAREGDVRGMEQVLKNVWNIRADELANSQSVEEHDPKMKPETPKYPTVRLLVTLAHAYGINNDMSKALVMIDHVSKRFGMPLSVKVWEQLVSWTYVMSAPRTKRAAEQPILPKTSLAQVWTHLDDDASNLEPTMVMFDHMIKNLAQRDHTRLMAQRIDQGMRLMRRAVKIAHEAYVSFVWVIENGTVASRMSQAQIEKMHRGLDHLEFQRRAHRATVQGWMKLLLGSLRTWHRVDRDGYWSTVVIPALVDRWRVYMPSTVSYETIAGRIDIKLRSEGTMNMTMSIRSRRRAHRLRRLRVHRRYLGHSWIMRPFQSTRLRKLTEKARQRRLRNQQAAEDQV